MGFWDTLLNVGKGFVSGVTGIDQSLLQGVKGAGLAGGAVFDRSLGYFRSRDEMEAERRSVQDTNAAQIELAQKQMNFQERMSSTAFQRQQVDLRAAGLPPWFANTGADSAQGAMANLEVPRRGQAKLALERSLVAAQASQMASAVSLNKQLERTEQSRQALNTAEALVKAQQVRSAAAIAKMDEQKADIRTSEQGKLMDWIDRVMDTLAPPLVAGAVGGASGKALEWLTKRRGGKR